MAARKCCCARLPWYWRYCRRWGCVRVLEAAGVRDILTKSQGSSNLLNVAMATLLALRELRSAEEMASMRGKPVETVRPFFERKKLTEAQ
ncbi:MAG: 30S ribosomal protein S5 [Chloroflexi bacterium OLB15]|nr:MAG: 30S ribosomal protein S5 [Chloroflexi bacterium OLB15]